MVHSIYKNIVKTGGVLLATLLYITLPHTCLAQSSVNGTVVDDYGVPVQGATVHIKGEKTGRVTNQDGAFNLPAGPGTVLVFEYPGYNTTEVKAKSSRPLFVRLSARYLQQTVTPRISTVPAGDTIYIPGKSASALNVLYGQANAGSFLGSISTVGSNQLSTTPASSYTYALPGRLAGLNVIQTSGFYTPLTNSLTSRDIFVGNIPNNTSGAGPTDNTEFNIQLRGHNASFGQSPIVVIDGVQRELYSLDPESIASVSVLKDALSTIMLGQNSARGALIVTTKQPVAGPPRVDFTAETGVQSPLHLPKPLPAYQYAYLLNEALLGCWIERRNGCVGDEHDDSLENVLVPFDLGIRGLQLRKKRLDGSFTIVDISGSCEVPACAVDDVQERLDQLCSDALVSACWLDLDHGKDV